MGYEGSWDMGSSAADKRPRIRCSAGGKWALFMLLVSSFTFIDPIQPEWVTNASLFTRTLFLSHLSSG